MEWGKPIYVGVYRSKVYVTAVIKRQIFEQNFCFYMLCSVQLTLQYVQISTNSFWNPNCIRKKPINVGVKGQGNNKILIDRYVGKILVLNVILWPLSNFSKHDVILPYWMKEISIDFEVTSSRPQQQLKDYKFGQNIGFQVI